MANVYFSRYVRRASEMNCGLDANNWSCHVKPQSGRTLPSKSAVSVHGQPAAGLPFLPTTLAFLGKRWGIPDLAHLIQVRMSTRLRVALARARPALATVTLHPRLLDAPRPVLREVLCHEVAHVVAWQLAVSAGRRPPRAHGVEWQQLVRRAGFTPRATWSREEVGDLLEGSTVRKRSPKRAWRHSCPVCHFERRAAAKMTRWRCPNCLDFGLNGILTITPIHQ